VYIVGIYIASLLVANVLANQMIVVFNQTASAGILTFPITYILASVLAEVYGYKWARRAAWSALALNALLAGLIWLTIMLPNPEWFDDTHFINAVGNSWRVVLASLSAFTIGKFANDRLFSHLKKGRANLEGFKFRAMVSSLLGHILDSSIFTMVAFSFVIDRHILPGMIIVSIALKWGYEWLALPLTAWFVRKAKVYEAGVG
jgi:uncharacterized integral membrane protein (TIGR00697 family)